MSFLTLLHAITAKQLASKAASPVRTPAPLRLSQGSAVQINVVPFVLAEDAGALFDGDIADHDTVVAVGRYSMLGLDFTRVYLSQSEGGYIHFASKGDEILETRIYQPYAEQIPATAEEWAFWLDDTDGYIGYPYMQSKDEDGPKQYQRSWSDGERRVGPMQPLEWIVDSAGNNVTVQHQMMHYSRVLGNSIAEHMLVSAVSSNDAMSVNFWLGIDLDVHDLKVYPAGDAATPK